jgi:hypothetical protein
VFDGCRLADIPAAEGIGAILEGWQSNLGSRKEHGTDGENDRDKRGLDLQSLLQAEVSVRHAFNWGSKDNSPNTLLPATLRPFSGIERVKVPPQGAAVGEGRVLPTRSGPALHRRGPPKPNRRPKRMARCWGFQRGLAVAPTRRRRREK